MQNSPRFPRRLFLARAAGLTLTLGMEGLWRPAAATRNPYARGHWLAGDHHIHTKFSYDGQYEIERQVANAAQYGLRWCAITDHGGPNHDKTALELAYPDLIAARKRHPQVVVFQGMEWNIPAAEHGSVILPPTPDEASRIAEFEARYDEKNTSRENTPANTEADAIAAVQYLQSLSPRPLFMANHPARRGLDSPQEMRAWADAGPDVAHGFEGAPGHAAFSLVGKPRCDYDRKPDKSSWPGYPPDSYRTWGGYDWYAAKVGGLWDSLLGEGRPWYITANSDSHRHWDDRAELDTSTYRTRGYVTETGKQAAEGTDFDFYPGEYAKTWVFAPQRSPLAILDALRGGHMFTVLGDLIDRLELWAHDGRSSAAMGGTLRLSTPGETVEIVLKLRVPQRPNFGGRQPRLHHVDIISGEIYGPTSDREMQSNPSTRVIAQVGAAEMQREGDHLVHTLRFANVRQSFYVRVRGTNTEVQAPQMDSATVNPWDDLWFYSNPVFVRV